MTTPLRGDFGAAMRLKFALQWHMFLIITLVIAGSVIANFLLRESLPQLAVRYAVIIALAYFLLLLLLRLWLSWLKTHFSATQLQQFRYQPRFVRHKSSESNHWDWLDPSGCNGDLEGCLVMAAIAIVLALCGVFLWGVFSLLSDAAVIMVDIAAAYLFSRLISQRTLYVGDRNWFVVVLRHTGLPLLSAYALVAVIAIASHVKCPQADSIGDLFFANKCALAQSRKE